MGGRLFPHVQLEGHLPRKEPHLAASSTCMAIIAVRCKASLRYEDLEDQLVVRPVSDVPKNPRNAYLCFFCCPQRQQGAYFFGHPNVARTHVKQMLQDGLDSSICQVTFDMS